MKKKETYVPQFELPDETEIEERQIEYCQQCGKQTISLHKGLCFECRNNSNISSREHDVDYGLGIYLNWVEANAKRRGSGFPSLIYYLIFYPLRKYGFSATWFVVAIQILSITIIVSEHVNVFGWLVSIALVCICVTLGFLSIKRKKKKRIAKYYSYCNIQVRYLNEGEWKCPCCNNINLFKNSCEVCGIAPKLIGSNQE